jgi:hypothetical protein
MEDAAPLEGGACAISANQSCQSTWSRNSCTYHV